MYKQYDLFLKRVYFEVVLNNLASSLLSIIGVIICSAFITPILIDFFIDMI